MINIFSFNLKSAEFHFMQEVILITNAHIETLMNIKQSELFYNVEGLYRAL